MAVHVDRLASDPGWTQSDTQVVVNIATSGFSAGQLAIAHVVWKEAGVTVSMSNEFSAITDVISVGSFLKHQAFKKVLTQQDIDNSYVTATASASANWLSMQVYAIDDYNTITNIDDYASGTASDTASPSIDASVGQTVNYDLILLLGCSYPALPGRNFASQAIANTNPTWTIDYESWDPADPNSVGLGMFGCHATRNWPEETGNVSWTNNGDDTTDNAVIVIAVKNTQNATSSTSSSSTSTSTSSSTSSSTSTSTSTSSSTSTTTTFSSSSTTSTSTSTTSSTTSSTTTQFNIPLEDAATIVPILEITRTYRQAD